MSDLLESWNKLDADHKRFVLRVRDSNGCKHGAAPTSIDSEEKLAPPNDEHLFFYSFSF